MSTFALRFNKNCDMDYLPKDPAILVSSVNMLLRDEEFDTLQLRHRTKRYKELPVRARIRVQRETTTVPPDRI